MRKRKGLKLGGILFGKLTTSKKKGPYGPLKSRKILSGRNKGKSALWF
jgi:hypothetical protein